MLEKPNLSDKKIITSLYEGFGVTTTRVEFLPLGNDSNAWTYRVCAEDGEAYFLKVKKGLSNPRGITISHYLRHHGLNQVVAPFPTQIGELWHPAGEYSLLLYPFIEGENGMQTDLTDRQWVEYGTFLKNLHAIRLPSDIKEQIPRETFIPKWMGVVRKIHEQLEQGNLTNPIEQKLTAFWRENDTEIKQIVQRTAELGTLLQQQTLEFVLCHADIHTANLLITPEQRMFVVDWDETILAPPERDLMFIVGDSMDGESFMRKHEALFFEGYGKIDINWIAFAYYCYEWVVQEIGDYGERVFFMEDATETTKQDALERFIELFRPGDVVEGAYRSEKNLT